MPVSKAIVGGTAGDKILEKQARLGSRNRPHTPGPALTPGGKELFSPAILKSRAENRKYLLQFQSWCSPQDKFALVTADLKNGDSKLPYAPAASVLRAIVAMFKVSGKNGPIEFTQKWKFTRDDHLVTSLDEIRTKVQHLTGKALSTRVIQRALLLLHDDGLIYKTKGYYGNTRQCRLFIDLKGWWLYTKLDKAIHKCLDKAQPVEVSFRLAKEGEYGFERTFNNQPNTPETAIYLNKNQTQTIDREQSLLENTVQNNYSEEIVMGKTENTPLARPFSNFEEPEHNIKTSIPEGEPSVTFTLTHQVQTIIEFIQNHEVFVDQSTEHNCLEDLTAQEVSALIRCVELKGLTLSFLKKYRNMLRRTEDWFLKCKLGFFCDNFFVIKKLFYRMESEDHFTSYISPGEKIIDFTDAAERILHQSIYYGPCTWEQEDPKMYRVLLALDPRIKDDGWHSACIVVRVLTLTNILPEDRDFIVAEHRYRVRHWFFHNPQAYFGLKMMGYPIDKALDIEDDTKMRQALEQEFLNCTTFLLQFEGQLIKANMDLCAIEKYQDPDQSEEPECSRDSQKHCPG